MLGNSAKKYTILSDKLGIFIEAIMSYRKSSRTIKFSIPFAFVHELESRNLIAWSTKKYTSMIELVRS